MTTADKSIAKALGAKCDVCPLKNQPFVAPWNINHGEILFIGEAPGTQEAIEGIPFVGPSGQLLDKVIERAGHDPLWTARTNACLCKPFKLEDGSVTPPDAALEACFPALSATLESFPGQVVVPLGAVAMEAVDNFIGGDRSGGILSRRGVWCKGVHDGGERGFEEFHYLPTLHPAFVLRAPGHIQKLIDDVHKAYLGPYARRQFLDVDYTIVEDFEQLKEMILDLKSKPLVSFDVESEHLQWYDTPDKRAANVLCLVFAGEIDRAYIVPDATLAQPRSLEFLQMFFDTTAVLCHNGKFDQSIALARLGLRVTLGDDTMLAHYVTNEGKSGHGLKELAQVEFQLPDYEEELLVPIFAKHGMNRTNRNYNVVPRAILYKYAAIDGVVTLALYEVLKQRLIEEDQFDWPYRNLLIRASNALAQVEVNGIPIDYEYLVKVEDVLIHDVERRANDIRLIIEPLIDPTKHERLLRLMRQSKGKKFNPGSNDQMHIALYDLLGLKLKRQPMKPTSTNTSEECLNILLESYPDNTFMRAVIDYRHTKVMLDTYVTKLLQLADDNEVVHVSYNINGTETGRLSANDSLHGIPRPERESVPKRERYGAMIRGAFRAPPGYKLIAADYAQAELCCFADETQEPFLLKAYNDGLDVHNETVKIMCKTMGIEYSEEWKESAHGKEIRTLAKNVNFGGLLYLGGPAAIAAMTGLDKALVKQVMDYYFDKLAVARDWQLQQFRFAKKNGYVVNRFGRKRRFLLQTMHNIDEIRKASVNAVIQGDASDLTLLSVCELVERGIIVVHTVHDSIIILERNELAMYTAAIVKQVMERLGSKWFPSIPWQVDIEIGDYWYAKRPKL